MPSDSPFPVPAGGLLQWAIDHPDELSELVQFVNRLKALQVSITLPGTARPYNLLDSSDNALLAIPLKFGSTIAPPTGGSTVDTQCRTQLSALLTALNLVGMN